MRVTKFSTLLFLLSILFYWFPPSIQFLARRRFLKQARFVMDVLHQLSITPLQIYNVRNLFDCTLKCIEHDQCLSFNIAVNSTGGLKLCQLLSTDKYNASSNFAPSAAFNYHHIHVGLERGVINPCRNNGTLHNLYWTGSYKCTCSNATLIIEGKHCEFIKLNSNPVLIRSKNSGYATVNAILSGQIIKFRLVYVSGGISCYTTTPTTNFGCGNPDDLLMIITNTANQMISPHRSSLSSLFRYRLPGTSSNDLELILPEISPALHVTKGQKFRIWYSEDLFNYGDGDNYGSIYADVYGYY